MLTRKECKALVGGLGKFEGEPIYSPYFYELMMFGSAQGEAGPDNVDTFIVTDGDRLMFPELDGIKKLVQYTDESGFVYILTPDQLK